MPTLGKVPRGLLALLGEQNFGESPRFISDTIVPMVDLTANLLLNEMQQQTAIVGAPVNGVNAAITVPAGEVWRIHALDILVICGAGDTCDGAAGVRMNGVSVAMTPYLVVAANQTRRSTTGPCAEFWLGSGAELVAILSNVTAPDAVALQVLYSPYKA